MDTENKHCELWASLSLVAKKDDQHRGGPLRGGVLRDGAGGHHVRGGEDGQRDESNQLTVHCLLQPGGIGDGRQGQGGVHSGSDYGGPVA